MTEPTLKLLAHPTKNDTHHMSVFDFGFGKVTVETSESRLTLGDTLYYLELAKKTLMDGK